MISVENTRLRGDVCDIYTREQRASFFPEKKKEEKKRERERERKPLAATEVCERERRSLTTGRREEERQAGKRERETWSERPRRIHSDRTELLFESESGTKSSRRAGVGCCIPCCIPAAYLLHTATQYLAGDSRKEPALLWVR